MALRMEPDAIYQEPCLRSDTRPSIWDDFIFQYRGQDSEHARSGYCPRQILLYGEGAQEIGI